MAASATSPRRREGCPGAAFARVCRLADDPRVVERELARDALVNPDVKRLMTIPGIDMVVAVGLMAAIGPIERFSSPDRLVAYLGLNPTCISPATAGRGTGGSASRATPMPGPCRREASRRAG